jgi:hypothetical protein
MELIMKNNIVLYLPTDSESAIVHYSKELSKVFGGCTIIPGCKGAWLDDSGKLIRDNITLLKCFIVDDFDCSSTSILTWDAIARNFAEEVKLDFNQDCVSLEINGELFFI